MEPFSQHTGVVAPLEQTNIDTDAIIPKQFLKSIHRTGFGDNLFDSWRYLDEGQPGQDSSQRPENPDFVLNQAPYRQASILLTGRNFGCGSSREHAPWALKDFGIRTLIAPSYADIFYNNCFKNGILPVILPEDTVERLFREVNAEPGCTMSVDLPAQTVTTPSGETVRFDVDGFRKHMLVEGLDEIGLTLQHEETIRAYEERRRKEAPWLFRA